MIERTVTGYDVICDGDRCSEFLEVDSVGHEWGELLQGMRDAGWKSMREHGQWCHYCPGCLEEHE